MFRHYHTFHMKTSVILKRELNGVTVRQDSKTSFFNATDLIDIHNARTGDQKRVQDYFDNKSTREFMNALAQAENSNSANQRDLDNGLAIRRRGNNGGTWVHPYVFIDLAMWLSPEFKVTVIRWVYDNLIKFRNDAGDAFKEVNEALFNMYPNSPPFAYSNEARMINKIVFNDSNAGQRNDASEAELLELRALQKADVKFINQGLDYYDRYEKLKEIKRALLLTM